MAAHDYTGFVAPYTATITLDGNAETFVLPLGTRYVYWMFDASDSGGVLRSGNIAENGGVGDDEPCTAGVQYGLPVTHDGSPTYGANHHTWNYELEGTSGETLYIKFHPIGGR